MKYLLVFLATLLYGGEYYYEFGKKVELTPAMDSRDSTNSDIHVYKTRDGKKVKFKHEVMIKFKDDIDIEDFFKSFNIKNYKRISEKVYLVKPPKDMDVIVLAKDMYESNKLVYAIPNKINNYKKR